MKKCISCGLEKNLDDFYVHSKMKDGRLNKCKDCSRKYQSVKLKDNMKKPDFVKKEKERVRERDHRLRNTGKPIREMLPRIYNSTWRNHNAQYPEKYSARSISQKIKPKVEGNEMHHWSYKTQNAKSLIEISKDDHYKLHKKLIYNQKSMCYETIDGHLLDTKKKHIEFIKKIFDE